VQLGDAASAAVLAVEQTARGVFDIVDDEPAPASQGWVSWRRARGEAPAVDPMWLARLLAGEVVVTMLTRGRGVANAKAKRGRGWKPRDALWRWGCKDGLA
jgi:hypothetical protein